MSDDGAGERAGGLRRALGSGQLAMIAIGGAIGTGLFLGSGFAIGIAGPAVLVSYAIGAVVTLLLMGALAEMTVADPSTGSFGAHAERYLGPLAGFLVRWAYLAAIVLAIGTEVTAVALYMRYWFPAVAGGWWIGGFALALVAVNAASVRLFGAVEYAFSAVKIAAILAFLVLGSVVLARGAGGGGGGTGAGVAAANYADFLPNGAGGAWVAVIVAIFSYLSVEMIAVAAGEAADPRRAIVAAFRATLVRLVLFYLATLALMLALVPWRALAGGATSPFVTVMAATGVPGAAGLVNAVVLVAALSAMNSQLYTASRMLWSLAAAGQAPVALGRVSARGVPLTALAASTLGIALAGVVHAADPQGAFAVMVAVSIFGALFTWMMIFATHLAFRRQRGAPTDGFRMRGAPWTSAAGMAAMAAILATTAFAAPFRATLACGVPFLLVLVAAYRWKIAGAEKKR